MSPRALASCLLAMALLPAGCASPAPTPEFADVAPLVTSVVVTDYVYETCAVGGCDPETCPLTRRVGVAGRRLVPLTKPQAEGLARLRRAKGGIDPLVPSQIRRELQRLGILDASGVYTPPTASLTPWTSDISAAGYSLTSLSAITGSSAGTLDIGGANGAAGATTGRQVYLHGGIGDAGNDSGSPAEIEVNGCGNGDGGGFNIAAGSGHSGVHTGGSVTIQSGGVGAFAASTIVLNGANTFAGTGKGTISATGDIAVTGSLSVTGTVRAPDGSVGAPSITFNNDTDCGIYRIGANNPALSAGGVKVVDMTTTAVTVPVTLAASTITGSTIAGVSTGISVTGGFAVTGPVVVTNSAGTSGQVLTSAGTGLTPTWTTPLSGAGVWTSYTPTISWTGVTVTGQWSQVGKVMTERVLITMSGSPTGTTLTFTPRVNPDLTAQLTGAASLRISGWAALTDSGSTINVLPMTFQPAGRAGLGDFRIFTSYTTGALASATSPFSFGTADEVAAEFSYAVP